MTDSVVSVAAKVAEYLVAPVGRRCGYVIFTDSYVGQLREELEKLHEVRVGVQRSVNDAENNMMDIRLEVNRWKNDAENSADEARGVLNNDRRANKTCFCGWLPNPKERYCLGRDARKTAQAIQALIPQGNFERVYYERAPPGHVPSASDVNLSADDGGDTITDSRASIFRDIVEALDDEKQKVIGVYGPGGVGKTTLLEEVEKKLKKEGRPFRMIVKAKVSQTPDLNKIQDDIAYFFGLKLKDEPSEVGRRDLLCQRLQKDPSEKILIILDDLWKELDLREVGIPSGDESKGCKLLLTSRFKNVLEQMKCDTPIFHLEGLKYDEAFRLFEKTVGDRLKEDEELKAIAPKVVKKLAGLPLLIISVACSLKDRNVDAWRIALKKIDLSKMETIVKLSYDHLKSEDTKTLFLLCGLIGGTIQVEILLVLGMGLGLFEEFGTTIQDSRAGLNAMLNELHSVCLLLDGGDDKNNVTIHDLYSEVVTSTPFGGQNSLMMNSNYGSWPKEKLEKCWAICQVHVGRDRLDKLMKCQFANLKILMLSQPPNWYKIPEHLRDMGDHLGLLDFTCMKELQVLYLCSMRITSLHSSIRILGNLQSLYLESCNVEDVAILGNLKALQILSFARSTISRLPKKIQELTNLRLLNLSYCKLKIIKPDVLKCLTNLEELLMMGSFNQWMGKNEKPLELRNAGLAELRSMTKLNSLEISIRDPIVLLEVDDLPFENLTRFWINIGNIDRREFKGLKTMKIKLEAHDSILSKTWIQKTLQKTQYLCLDGLGEFEKAHKLCIQGFPELKHLDIQNSPSMKYVASSSNSAFTILESLFLNNLINLEKICHHHITADCFSKLKDVIVNNCNRLKYLWCLSQTQNFVQLEKIEVWNCGSVRAIARKDIVSTNYRVELPYLHHLHLVGLPNMTTFCTRAEMTSEGAPIQARAVDGGGGGDEGTESVITTSDLQNTYSDSFFDGKISLPNLEHLGLHSVGSFKRIWHDELSRSSFCKLATITIQNCSDLLHIFPSTIIGGLTTLQSVKVFNCPSLKSLFDFGSLDSNTEQTVVLLPKLVSINIGSCPSLESLFNCGSLDSNDKVVLLPKLEEVSVSGAKRLRYLFSKYTATTLVKLQKLNITKCKQMKEVILEKEAGRSEAEVMSLSCLSELTLKELDNLISFGLGSCSYYFSSLQDLRIVGCCNFRVFISSPTSVKTQLGGTAKENDKSPQPLFNEMVTFPNITSLEINGLRCKELWNNQIPIDSFQKLESLELNNCDNLRHIATSYMWKKLQRCLKKLKVFSCRSIEIIYDSDGTDTKSGELRRLALRDLENLRCIWESNSLPNIPFPNLIDIEAVRCPRLEMLFPTFTTKFLGQIEELVVESREDMELIVGYEKWEELTGTTITFSELTALILFELPKFRSFLPEKYSLKFRCSQDFPSLHVMSIKSCGAEPDQVLGNWEDYQLQRRFRWFS